MEEIKNVIIFQGKKIVRINKENLNKHILYSEEGEEYLRKDFNNFEIYCSCGNSLKLKKLTELNIKKEWFCRSCRTKGENNGMFGKKHSEDTLKEMSESRKGEKNRFYGKKQTEETKNKISKSRKGKTSGENNPMYGINVYDYIKEKYGQEVGEIKIKEIKNKISLSVSGVKNPFYGKKHSDENRKKISEGIKNSEIAQSFRKNIDYRIKMSDTLKGRIFSDEHVRKLRLAGIERIKKQIEELKGLNIDYYRIIPAYNPIACELFDKLMMENNTNIQHAKNGGEYHIKELGYFVDGYDKENNIVYEFDEKRHFNMLGELKDKDKKRQIEIENFLGCKFIRIKYDEIS